MPATGFRDRRDRSNSEPQQNKLGIGWTPQERIVSVFRPARSTSPPTDLDENSWSRRAANHAELGTPRRLLVRIESAYEDLIAARIKKAEREWGQQNGGPPRPARQQRGKNLEPSPTLGKGAPLCLHDGRWTEPRLKGTGLAITLRGCK